MSAPQPKIAKNTKTSYFGGLRSFKVIDLNTPIKLVTSASYVKQHVCVSATLFTLDEPIVVK